MALQLGGVPQEFIHSWMFGIKQRQQNMQAKGALYVAALNMAVSTIQQDTHTSR